MLGVYEVFMLLALQHIINFFVGQSPTIKNGWEEESMVSETIIFQIFFYFIICNLILSKTIKSYDFNFLSELWGKTGVIILILILIQGILVTYGDILINFTPLSFVKHVLAISVGFTPLLWGTIVK